MYEEQTVYSVLCVEQAPILFALWWMTQLYWMTFDEMKFSDLNNNRIILLLSSLWNQTICSVQCILNVHQHSHPIPKNKLHKHSSSFWCKSLQVERQYNYRGFGSVLFHSTSIRMDAPAWFPSSILFYCLCEVA